MGKSQRKNKQLSDSTGGVQTRDEMAECLKDSTRRAGSKIPAGEKKRLTQAEKKRWIEDQARGKWSNRELAKTAGVSEGSVRRWQKEFREAAADQTSTSATTQRRSAVPRPVIPPPQPGQCSPSITQMQELTRKLKLRCAALEEELALLKNVVRHYILL